MVEINELVNSMNKGSKDCIQEGKQYRFPVFLRELDPEERTGKRIEDIDSIDECCYEHDEEELEEEPHQLILMTKMILTPYQRNCMGLSISKLQKICF